MLNSGVWTNRRLGTALVSRVSVHPDLSSGQTLFLNSFLSSMPRILPDPDYYKVTLSVQSAHSQIRVYDT